MYWSALAQIALLLGLALVIEGRALRVRWRSRRTHWLQDCYFGLVALSLLGLAVVLFRSLRALRGEAVAAGWEPTAELAVVMALGTLIVGPALDLLVVASAPGSATDLTSAPAKALAVLKLRRRVRLTLDQANRARSRSWDVVVRARAVEAHCLGLVQRHERLMAEFPVLRGALAEQDQMVRENLTEAVAHREEGVRSWRSAIITELDASTTLRQSMQEINEGSKNLRALRRVDLASRLHDPASTPSIANLHAEPDDGGFLP